MSEVYAGPSGACVISSSAEGNLEESRREGRQQDDAEENHKAGMSVVGDSVVHRVAESLLTADSAGV
jgi:hypothetical protein